MERETHSISSGQAKICQNCQKEFVIEPEDFNFYEKIKVPAPTWCLECRLVRKLLWRNERNLFRINCQAPNHKEKILSIFPSDSERVIYDQDYWWSDDWDPMEYGKRHDFSKPFFEQFKNLIQKVPFPNLINTNTINSDYCHSLINCKNCYLTFVSDYSENLLFSALNGWCKDSLDCHWSVYLERCYELIDSRNCYNVCFSRNAIDCYNSAFLFDCINCNNCLGCINLRNKSYHIFNQPYSKEEYEKKIREINPNSFEKKEKFKEGFIKFIKQYPCRHAFLRKYINCSGNNILESKNCHNCFEILKYQDSKYCLDGYNGKDCHDLYSSVDIESAYESISVLGRKNLFSKRVWYSFDCQYSYYCYNCNNLFGCVGLRNKQYCILNKQYAKEEYEETVPRIIEQMSSMPYVDKKGRVYKYGEFFPPELSPFCYNETIAQEYFPLTREQALEQGYAWKDPETRDIKIDIKTEDLPDLIKDVRDGIIGKVIQCANANAFGRPTSEHSAEFSSCTTAFRIIPRELEFYRKMNLPLPRLCPNCRHYQRLKQRNPLKLWRRQCMCGTTEYKNAAEHFHKDKPCPNEFETSYAPEHPEIVYCEECYKREVN